MARKRRPSDDIYNARRRVRRLADRLERQGDSRRASELRTVAATSAGTTQAELDAIYNAQRKERRSATQAQQTQPTAQRQPRPKRPSDELYNARRRLRRQADKLEREAAKVGGKLSEQMRSFAASLRRQAESSLGLKGAKERIEAIERLGDIREMTRGASYGKSAIFRRNLIIMQQLNAAGTKDADSSVTQREKDVFWAAVKGLWPEGSDVPRNQRYERVIEHFYFSGGSDARDFAKWLARDKGIEDMRDVAGDLSLIFEYITTELNDPEEYNSPEVDYDELKKLLLTLR